MANVDSSCIQNAGDPYDIGWRISSDAPHVPGLCVDATKIRPVRVLSSEGDSYSVTNFFHDGEFWNARFLKSDVSAVSVMSSRIADDVQFINVIHIQTRFYLRHGVQLSRPSTGEPGPLLESLVISWEPAYPAQGVYNHLTTFFRNYPLVGRMISAGEPMAAEEHSQKKVVRSSTNEVRLLLDAPVAHRLLENHISESERRQLDLAYLLVRRNCATSLFDILDATLTQVNWPHLAPRFRTGLTSDPIAGPTERALKARHLVPPRG